MWNRNLIAELHEIERAELRNGGHNPNALLPRFGRWFKKKYLKIRQRIQHLHR